MKVIKAFKNPVSRPRAIIWTGTALIAVIMFMTVMVAATTSYWFCAEICHAVQDDSINAYNNSSHSEVSCVSCHMPAGADPVSYMIHKVEALAELPMTVMGTYEIPLNGESHVALGGKLMQSMQCTQCHDLAKRKVTPSKGMKIDHIAHSDENIGCSICHNRIAHKEEGIKLVNKDPKTKKLNAGHEDFMSMTACYRCHRLANDGIDAESPFEAPGKCDACHGSGFDLKPKNHKVKNFLRDAHGKLAEAQVELVKEAKAEHAKEEPEKGHGKLTEEGKAVAELPKAEVINECYTCHAKNFCVDCHGGVEMPHDSEFAKDHKKYATKYRKACEYCHGGPNMCTSCHHSDPNVKGYTYDNKKPWIQQHYVASGVNGAAACFECHDPTYCAHCHVTGSTE